MDVLTPTYSHVIGTTAHEQMSKINSLFEKKAQNPRKPSILKQLDDAKKESEHSKSQPNRGRKKDAPEL